MKVSTIVGILVVFIVALSTPLARVSALDDCSAYGITPTEGVGVEITPGQDSHTIVFDDTVDGITQFDHNYDYYLTVWSKYVDLIGEGDLEFQGPMRKPRDGKIPFYISSDDAVGGSAEEALSNNLGNKHYVILKSTQPGLFLSRLCYAGYYTTKPAEAATCPPGQLYVYQYRDVDVNKNGKIDKGVVFGEEHKACYAGQNSCFAKNTDTYIEVKKLNYTEPSNDNQIRAKITPRQVDVLMTTKSPGTYGPKSFRPDTSETYSMSLFPGLKAVGNGFTGCATSFQVKGSCDNKPENCGSVESSAGNTSAELLSLCETLNTTNTLTLYNRCAACVNKENPGAWTAIGCIETDPKLFLKQLLGFAVGIAGGIAFLMILFGGFQVMTSAGNPEKLTAGRELLSAAITGLLFIIFSLFILRLIGVTLLGIPGFT